MKINESNITIMVKDMDASIKFYESIGLVLKNRWDNHYAMLETTGITIGLHPTVGKTMTSPSTSISIGFMIDDANDAKSILEKNKIKYDYEEGKSGIYLHFHDLDGTILYFTQPKWKHE